MQLGGWSDPASNWFKRVSFFVRTVYLAVLVWQFGEVNCQQTRTNLGEKPSRLNDTGMMSALFQIYFSNTQARKKAC